MFAGGPKIIVTKNSYATEPQLHLEYDRPSTILQSKSVTFAKTCQLSAFATTICIFMFLPLLDYLQYQGVTDCFMYTLLASCMLSIIETQ